MGLLPQRVKRVLTAILLLAVAAAMWAFGGLDCPFWQAGLPCPGCGLTRATAAASQGDLPAAFRLNPFFPYYLAVTGLLLLGFVLYIVGREQAPESFAQRTVFRVPKHLHAAISLVGLAYNFYDKGFNGDGWVPRCIAWLSLHLG